MNPMSTVPFLGTYEINDKSEGCKTHTSLSVSSIFNEKTIIGRYMNRIQINNLCTITNVQIFKIYVLFNVQ